MPADTENSLLALLWTTAYPIGRPLRTASGREASILECGTLERERGMARHALVRFEEGALRGDVLVGDRPALGCGPLLLRVVARKQALVIGDEGTLIEQAVLPVPDQVLRACNRLKAGAPLAYCGRHLREWGALRCSEIFTSLVHERFSRKCDEVKGYFTACGSDWNQALHLLLFRVMGDMQNREAFLEVARRVPLRVLLREKSTPAAEAMLLGASGLLSLYPTDDYVAALEREYYYLSRKYAIEALRPGDWRLERIHPNNHPILRLAQLASLTTSGDLLFERTVRCSTAEQVRQLFSAEASPYWKEHYLPGSPKGSTDKRIGRGKADLLGINLVAPLKFAYGEYVCDETMRAEALALLEAIPPESNRYVNPWRREGVQPLNAFDSQALLQLAREYCAAARCIDCPVGRRVIKKCVMSTAEAE